MSAEAHLAKFGVTIQQANDFILMNVEQPNVIYDIARDKAVTISMLSEITSFHEDVIREYFASSDLDAKLLDDTSILINSDLGALEGLVAFNDNTGILSTISLKEEVQLRLDSPFVYEFVFVPPQEWEKLMSEDDIYDAEELGVTHLSNVPATSESIESLFYGTLLNIYSTLDEVELDRLNEARDSGTLHESQELLNEALADSSSPVVWADEILAELVIVEAANIVNNFFDDVSIVGVLDQSFLGFSGG